MFTVAKIKDGGPYLKNHLSANDYYSEKKMVIGQWVVNGSEHLGLRGEIEAGDPAFEALKQNRHPDGSGKLTPRDGEGQVKFFDFQSSAQKSVSIMAVTMGYTPLLEAHDAAAALAFGELERFAARQANTYSGRANQRTSNVGDPVCREGLSKQDGAVLPGLGL